MSIKSQEQSARLENTTRYILTVIFFIPKVYVNDYDLQYQMLNVSHDKGLPKIQKDQRVLKNVRSGQPDHVPLLFHRIYQICSANKQEQILDKYQVQHEGWVTIKPFTWVNREMLVTEVMT